MYVPLNLKISSHFVSPTFLNLFNLSIDKGATFIQMKLIAENYLKCQV